jgi:hypothetical protein
MGCICVCVDMLICLYLWGVWDLCCCGCDSWCENRCLYVVLVMSGDVGVDVWVVGVVAKRLLR